MLLYLVKHSRPDIANAVRELSKVADGATEAVAVAAGEAGESLIKNCFDH